MVVSVLNNSVGDGLIVDVDTTAARLAVACLYGRKSIQLRRSYVALNVSTNTDGISTVAIVLAVFALRLSFTG